MKNFIAFLIPFLTTAVLLMEARPPETITDWALLAGKSLIAGLSGNTAKMVNTRIAKKDKQNEG